MQFAASTLSDVFPTAHGAVLDAVLELLFRLEQFEPRCNPRTRQDFVTVIVMRLVLSAIDCGASSWVVVAGLGLGWMTTACTIYVYRLN